MRTNDKEVTNMLLFGALVAALILIGIIVAVVVGTAGIAFFVVFGDVIVCIAIIVFLVKLIFGRKKKK
mgnify:FL=1|jgi:hypothetical protein